MKPRGTGNARLTIGLYNCYDNLKLREAHRRAIARAGPLAYAFDMNLALIGFPFEPNTLPRDVSKWVRETTSIGEDGALFTEVEVEDRMTLVEAGKGFPPQFGQAVATTCRPDPRKAVTAESIARDASYGQGSLILFGLGPKGLPKDVKESAPRHLEITGKGASLETCTALGAVTAVLAMEIKRLRTGKGGEPRPTGG